MVTALVLTPSSVSSQESGGPTPNTRLPALVGLGNGQDLPCELQAPRSDHGRPRHLVWTELAQRPGTFWVSLALFDSNVFLTADTNTFDIE